MSRIQHPAPIGTYDASDPFGSMSGGRTYPHTGSDYGIAFGTVESVATSIVWHTGYNPGNGNYVCVYVPGFDYKFGVNGGLYVAYLHLSEIYVTEGQTVPEGAAIGISGNSGSNSRGPHLHITMSNSDLAYLGMGDKVDPFALIEAVRATPAPAPAPVAPKPVAPKPLTELQKLRAQRAKLKKEIDLLKKKGDVSSPRAMSLGKRLAAVISRIASLTKNGKR